MLAPFKITSHLETRCLNTIGLSDLSCATIEEQRRHDSSTSIELFYCSEDSIVAVFKGVIELIHAGDFVELLYSEVT